MVGKVILICLALALLVLTEVWINTFLYRNHQSLRWYKFIGAEAGTILGLLAVVWLCRWLYHFKVVAWVVNLLDSIWGKFIGYLPHWHFLGLSWSPIILWLVVGLVVAYIYFFIAGLLKRREIIGNYKQWQHEKQEKMLKGDAPTYKNELPKKNLAKSTPKKSAKTLAKKQTKSSQSNLRSQPVQTISSNSRSTNQVRQQTRSQAPKMAEKARSNPARSSASINPHFLNLPTAQFDYHSKLGIQQAYNRAKQSGLLVMPTHFGYVALYANASGLSALKSAIRPTPLAKFTLPNSPSLVQFTTTQLQAITLNDYLQRLSN